MCRPGYDMVFSAPQSVSVIYGLADPRVADQVRDATVGPSARQWPTWSCSSPRVARRIHHDSPFSKWLSQWIQLAPVSRADSASAS